MLAEATGSEIWIDDVTGDGLGDLLIGRQNHTPGGSEADPRIGAGALSIVVGGAWLRSFSAGLGYLDLRNPDPSIPILTIVGREALDQFGIWVRTGDVDSDKIADLVVGADQEDLGGENNSGAAYVIRGGTPGCRRLDRPVRSPIWTTMLEGRFWLQQLSTGLERQFPRSEAPVQQGEPEVHRTDTSTSLGIITFPQPPGRQIRTSIFRQD